MVLGLASVPGKSIDRKVRRPPETGMTDRLKLRTEVSNRGLQFSLFNK
jgi:hypothetical protein